MIGGVIGIDEMKGRIGGGGMGIVEIGIGIISVERVVFYLLVVFIGIGGIVFEDFFFCINVVGMMNLMVGEGVLGMIVGIFLVIFFLF